ncbi:hypothetical protein HMPREF1214_00478 [Bacteroides sp. HPS0048]|uniref:endo-beta-N-acetylglucosaminidase n=1 Tax=Bacteroides sp. HPS0048 TaxID=1078089 RepID=UPI0003656DB8|nr:LamG-like jellyroll fold domain-containing protein [Bacteroides sp. HPS0048]EOA60228.1 hypothetical protein HMPREF1214_00478 [Bacteroides sp. HPS0048]
MKKFRHLLLGTCVVAAGMAYAQSPSHPQYVKGSDSNEPFYTAYRQWEPGKALYSAGDAKDDEQFYISRVKPKKRFSFTQTQVDPEMNSDRKLLWWCPIGTEGWNAIPTYFFNSEVFSMWSYVDIYGNWTAPMIRMPGAFADICHKNGVVTSTLASVPWAATVSANDGGHGSNMKAMIDGGSEKLLKFLRYYGIDGIGYNSEFHISSTIGAENLKKLLSGAFAKKDDLKWPTFTNAWYSLMTNGGSVGGGDALSSNNQDWFHYNGHPTSDAYFMNYNWGANLLSTSQSTARQFEGRSSFDVYGGMDFQGRDVADWVALQSYDISVGIWGAHKMNMIFENRGELGADPTLMQKTYQAISENVFTGSSCNPVNTPAIKNKLAHSSLITDFHGFSSFITARSPLQSDDLANEPFVTYFNLGNGMFFNINGEKNFSNEWYNIGMQDYLPTWRWWLTSKFMGREESDVPANGLKAEFTWDDAWFGGSCLSIEGKTELEYLHLFKTKYSLVSGDKLLIRYKVLSGSGNMSWSCMAEEGIGTEVSTRSKALKAGNDWIEYEVKVGTSPTSLRLANKTLALLGMKFTNTSDDFKILIGEISLTRGADAITPSAPIIKGTKLMTSNYRGIDFKIYYEMASDIVTPGEPVYNEDVNTWYYKIYIQQEGAEKVMCTATTSWAAYVVSAPREIEGGNRIKLGVSAVSIDGKSESDITWSDYLDIPESVIIEGIEIDKAVIKAREEFTAKYTDPMHSAATRWEIRKASDNSIAFTKEGGTSVTTSLTEDGLYDLALTFLKNSKDTTEIYRGFVQVSGSEVGALPEIKELKANGSETQIEVAKEAEVEFSYIGKEADGTVSRGLRLPEQAFALDVAQLNLTDTSPFSICFWFKPNQFNHQDGGTQVLNIRTKEDKWPASDWGYVWSTIQPDNTYSISLRYHVANGGSTLHSKEFTFLPNQWTHIAFIIDWVDNGRQISLYANGNLIGKSPVFTDVYPWKNSNKIMIGGNAAARAGLDGYLDEFQFYKKALNLEEVRNSMKHQTEIPDGLSGYWDFESDIDENNYMLSTGNEKNLKAAVVAVQVLGEGKNDYVNQPVSYGAGAPFITGQNYKIETIPTWKLGVDATITEASKHTSTAGNIKANYAKDGLYEATLTLTNGWGTDSKTFQYVKVGGGTGVKENEVVNFSAYPNPFVDEVNVQFVNEGTYTVEIHNLAGQLVSTNSLQVNAGEFVRMNVSGSAGTYFITVKDNGKVLKSLKVIKK